MGNTNTAQPVGWDLSNAQFERIRKTVYRVSGIDLHAGKEDLVKGRLMKRLRILDLSGFDEYLTFMERDRSGQELGIMIDALTTNKTSFFREALHFDYIRDQLVPELLSRGPKMRFWNAGCSSGEEPYSLAMLLREAIPNIDQLDVRILATDLSPTMVKHGRQGCYEQGLLADIPPQMKKKYCMPPGKDNRVRMSHSIRSLVTFGQVNLMENWPMKGPFDVIMCRNVMIYFDSPTRQTLIQKFWNMLRPGGHLFIGHSESFTGLSHQFRSIMPAAYVKDAS